MKVEIRSNDTVDISGYVNVVGRESRVLHDAAGPFVEQVAPGAFAKALAGGAPVELRYNHREVAGGTSDGSLKLFEDSVGLFAEARGISCPSIVEAAKKKELRGWSFAFVKKEDDWKTDESGLRHRTLRAFSLEEVSALDITPAYIATSIEARGEDSVLVEHRAMMASDDVEYQTETMPQMEECQPDKSGYSSFLEVEKRRMEVYKTKWRDTP